MLVLVLGGAATWWTIARSLRPVDRMVETAEAIASGDLARRVPGVDPDTELGQLGTSLNEILAHIESAVETERARQERLRQFIADASHELRTLLTAVSGYAQLSRKGGLPTDADQKRAWEQVESEGRRMASLVDDLLTLTRLGQGKPLHLGEVDIMQVAGNAATDLLNNSRVHTPPGTSIDVSVSSAAGQAVIEAIVTAHGGTVTASNLETGGANGTMTFPRRSAAARPSH